MIFVFKFSAQGVSSQYLATDFPIINIATFVISILNKKKPYSVSPDLDLDSAKFPVQPPNSEIKQYELKL
jgi:hypothetical protein